jgi:hypothetical protein
VTLSYGEIRARIEAAIERETMGGFKEAFEWLLHILDEIENDNCTCPNECRSDCKGECGCEQCHESWMDFLSHE